jgi:hypothetical protein
MIAERRIRRLSIFDGAAEQEATPWTENQRRTAEDRLRRCRTRIFAQTELSRHDHDAGLDPLCIWQKLRSNARTGAVCTDQNIARRC